MNNLRDKNWSTILEGTSDLITNSKWSTLGNVKKILKLITIREMPSKQKKFKIFLRRYIIQYISQSRKVSFKFLLPNSGSWNHKACYFTKKRIQKDCRPFDREQLWSLRCFAVPKHGWPDVSDPMIYEPAAITHKLLHGNAFEYIKFS